MDCREVRSALWLAARESELSEGVGNHLARCTACSAHRLRHEALDRALKASLLTAPPPELGERLVLLGRAHIREMEGARKAPSTPKPILRGPLVEVPRNASHEVATLTVALLIALGISSMAQLVPSIEPARLALEFFVALRVLLFSPLMWLLPDAQEVLSWTAAAVAALSLAYLLRSPRSAYRGSAPGRHDRA